MRIRGALLAAGVAAFAAAPAFAQPPPADAIDALLRAPAKPVVPALTEPVFVNETGKAPDGPPSAADRAYESRLRASAASVRGFQGPMEGGWTLATGSRELYVLELVDRNGYVEGAWLDPRRTGALDASGFIDEIERRGGDLIFRFSAGAVAILRPAGGRWTGRLTEAGRTEAVTLQRRDP